jgi:hypothetical protein
MDEKSLRKQIGDKNVDSLVKHAKELKAQGKSPDQIAQAVKTKFQDPAINASILNDVANNASPAVVTAVAA